jgi:hypothetical protein
MIAIGLSTAAAVLLSHAALWLAFVGLLIAMTGAAYAGRPP